MGGVRGTPSIRVSFLCRSSGVRCGTRLARTSRAKRRLEERSATSTPKASLAKGLRICRLPAAARATCRAIPNPGKRFQALAHFHAHLGSASERGVWVALQGRAENSCFDSWILVGQKGEVGYLAFPSRPPPARAFERASVRWGICEAQTWGRQ